MDYGFIFTAGPKPIFTAGLGAGGEISAVKMSIFTASFSASSDNLILTAGP